MIKINDDMLNRSPYIDYMLYLFQVTSEEIYPNVIHVPTPEWNDYIEILYSRSNQALPEIIVDNDIPVTNIPFNDKDIVLAFSGGKDSVSHAAYLVDQDFNTILYYVKRANRSYPHEYDVAKHISEMLSATFVEDELHYSGKQSKKESPVKNHLILSLIIDYMIQNKITRCACGTYLEDTLAKTPTEFGLSDAYEFYRAFEKAIKSTFPSFSWCCWFNSEVHALAYLVNYHPELVTEYQSCMIPDRYRKRLRELHEKKFNITLLPNRCGSCWKCAQEYYILHLLHYFTLSDDYIKGSIIPMLYKSLHHVLAESEMPTHQLSVSEMVDNYITLSDVDKYRIKDNITLNINKEEFNENHK
jgi:hypothetical protein